MSDFGQAQPDDVPGRGILRRQSVSVQRADGSYFRIVVGDVFRNRDRRHAHMTVTVTGFWEDGSMAYVRRNTSRRSQAISTKRLSKTGSYERIRAAASGGAQ